jgi:hypothetical protein
MQLRYDETPSGFGGAAPAASSASAAGTSPVSGVRRRSARCPFGGPPLRRASPVDDPERWSAVRDVKGSQGVLERPARRGPVTSLQRRRRHLARRLDEGGKRVRQLALSVQVTAGVTAGHPRTRKPRRLGSLRGLREAGCRGLEPLSFGVTGRRYNQLN